MIYRDALTELSSRLEKLLETLPDNRLEARRQITRDLHFEPRAEELQTIVRIAADAEASGARKELPRALLQNRLLADLELRRLFEMKPLDAGEIDHSAAMLPEILADARRLETELRTLSAAEGVPKADRDFLMQVGNALATPREELLAGAVLADRLAVLTRAVINGNLDTTTPTLGDEERALIASLVTRAAIDADEQVDESDASRMTVDALAMHSLVDNLLSAWRGLGPPSSDDAKHREHRDALLERIQQARVALETIAARVQDQHDSALLAGLNDFAEEMRNAGRALFATKLRLAPVLRAPYDDPTDEEAEAAAVDTMRETLAECVAVEQALEQSPQKQSEEEVYLDALKDMRGRAARAEIALPSGKASRKARERRRMLVMGSLVFILGAISLMVNFVLLPRPVGAPQAPPMSEISTAVDPIQVDTAGPMMFTQVDGWNDLDADARRAQLDKLGAIVSGNGFSTMVVINEFGEPAGAWEEGRGGELIDAGQ